MMMKMIIMTMMMMNGCHQMQIMQNHRCNLLAGKVPRNVFLMLLVWGGRWVEKGAEDASRISFQVVVLKKEGKGEVVGLKLPPFKGFPGLNFHSLGQRVKREERGVEKIIREIEKEKKAAS